MPLAACLVVVGRVSTAQKESQMEFPHYSSTVLITAGVLVVLLVLGLSVLIAHRRSRTRRRAKRWGAGRHTIRSLSATERGRFAQLWSNALARFVDSPRAAVSEADQLLTEVMRVRGFPTADFDQRAADISLNHPKLAESYQAAHTLALKSRSGQASTEDLRQALVHCRVLFDELVESPPVAMAAAH
jgi:hypothetical protein